MMRTHVAARPKGPVVTVLFILAVLCSAGSMTSACARETDIAIRGYDPVAYFREERAVRGNRAFTFQWHGMTWHFSSKENRDLFAESPVMYAPQYDGYCAWAMTESRKAATDPEVWKIVNCRLYLNCSRSAFDKWSRDIPGNIRKADENWKKISGAK